MKSKIENYITLKAVQVNAGVVAWYVKELEKLVNKMVYGYTKELLSLYQDNKEQIEEHNSIYL